MNERFRAEILRAAAQTRPTAFVYVNLHNFKPLNVLLGHQRGDEHLVRVLRGLEELGRAWRVGGDEFVALGATADVVVRARAFSWLYHLVVGATEAWRFRFADERRTPVVPWRRFEVMCTPRCGVVELPPAAGPANPAELAEALQRAEDQCEAARATAGASVDGFAPLSRGHWHGEKILNAQSCPICSATSIVVADQDLGWARERCDACGASYERSDVLFVLGEESSGGYA